MISRTLQPHLEHLSRNYPVVTLTGPRQSGKTTLARMTFPRNDYVNLESPSEREFAASDPVGFLARHPGGVILDEIQRAPDLPSYIQTLVDLDPTPGRFLLTGSQNLGIVESVSQSLAGRTALLELLPLELEEIRRFPEAPNDLASTLWSGGYPRIHERKLDPRQWLEDYAATYLERDVRSVLNVGDLVAFQAFLRLCAGRVGQLLNLASLASDSGLSQPTARRWLSVLEAGFIAFRLPPFHANLAKRLVKTPKLYFYDSGLVASLLGIDAPEQLATHPLRGAIFEGWVVSEVLKWHRHRARRPHLFFYQERGRTEIDLVIEEGADLTLVEVKAGQTPSSSFFSAFSAFEKRLNERADARWRVARRYVVYAGREAQARSAGVLVPWADLPATLAGREPASG
jgi:predicted AAA+ superfamily ATPase